MFNKISKAVALVFGGKNGLIEAFGSDELMDMGISVG